ncbi:hypothetical protein ACFLWE_00955 [Chloroflexota bacterium]
MTNQTTQPENDDLVRTEWACPKCGERRMDYLVWIDEGERVKCGTCGFEYKP